MTSPNAANTDLQALQRFFRQNVPAAAQLELGPDTALLGSGLLDSLGVIQLMVFLGEDRGIAIDDEDFTPENLGSVGALLDFMARKRGAV